MRLLSVDPAHSLADVLARPLGSRWRTLTLPARAAVVARELSADAVWRASRRRLDAVLARDPAAAAAWSELLGTPEGFTEIAAAFELAATLDAHPYDLLIVDCPPTGHTLRLLAAPRTTVEWLHAGLATLLKYRQVAPLGQFADWLLHLSQSLARLRDLLRDPAACATVAVGRPGAVVEAETRRLEQRLRRDATPPAALISLGARRHTRAENPRAGAPGPPKPCAIIEAPACDPPPIGAVELLQWAATWIDASAPPSPRP